MGVSDIICRTKIPKSYSGCRARAGQHLVQSSSLSSHPVSIDPPKQHIEYTPNGVQYLVLLRVLLAEGQYH